jgi:DNA-nicking Smr family endonuclease
MANDREGRPLKKPAEKRPATRLSSDERELWEHAARDLKPIKGKKGRVHPAAADVEIGAASPPGRAAKTPERKPAPLHAAVPAAPKPKPAPAPLSLERRKARQLSSGRIEIEGRIDLHGMRQSEAHTALIRFLHRAYADGRRWVLVITGKGAAQRTSLDERLAAEGVERGVLRRNVPRWLAEPDLAGIIIGFTTAAIKHGGEGALYVHLRKRG